MKTSTILISAFLVLIMSLSLRAQPYGWYIQPAGTTNNLYDVNFVNPTTGYVVGQSGIILKTTNAGSNWITQTGVTPNHLFGVTFINPNTGWVVGDLGTILKTSNGGVNWSVKTSNTLYQLRSVFFINENTGYVAGWYGVILKTTNGGNNWTAQTSGISSNLFGVLFLNANTGYAVGWLGKMVKTTNGGTNWNNVNSSTTLSLENVNFINSNTGIISGENGIVSKTTNGGINWTTQNSSTSNWMHGVTSPFVNYSTLVGNLGTIRTTTNNGTNWYSQVSNTSYSLNRISYCDTLNGWAVGDYGTIIHTTTSGWLLPTAPSLTGPGNNTTCNPLTPVLTWNYVFPPSCYYRIQISTSSSFTTLALDTQNTIYNNLTVPANKLNFNTKYYWRVCATNQVGLGPWSSVRNFTTANDIPPAPILTSPANDTLNQALNTVLTWDTVLNASSFKIVVSTDTGFTSKIIDTSGITKYNFRIPLGKLQYNTKYYWKVSAVNTCITGNYSEVWNFKTILLTSLQTSQEIPGTFKLYQNYPNPFNPVTKIKFDVPKTAEVTITIYDASGRQVMASYKNNYNPGTYEYLFDAEKLSSGIYFYSIRSDGFTDIKKMIYLK